MTLLESTSLYNEKEIAINCTRRKSVDKIYFVKNLVFPNTYTTYGLIVFSTSEKRQPILHLKLSHVNFNTGPELQINHYNYTEVSVK